MRRAATIVIAVLLAGLVPLNASNAAAPRPGSPCPKAGTSKSAGGLKFTCLKSGKKLVWSKGVAAVRPVAAPTAVPSPTAMPTAAPTTATPTATPSPTPTDPVASRINATLNPGSGVSGVYLREIDGPAIADFQSTYAFDPASSIKALIALYAFDQKIKGNISLQTQIPKVTSSNPAGCPAPSTSGTISIETAIKQMMQISDNDRTLELMLYFGADKLNGYAKELGLTGTAFNIIAGPPGFTILGCVILPLPADPKTVDGHVSTLRDLTRIWGQASSLPTAERDALMRLTAGREMRDTEGYDFTGVWGSLLRIAREEAPASMSSAAVDKFTNAMRSNQKGGSYTICYKTANCTTTRFWLSMIGVTTLPYCQAPGSVTTKRFVWGYFLAGVDGTMQDIDDKNPATKGFVSIKGDIMREQIRTALNAWAPCS